MFPLRGLLTSRRILLGPLPAILVLLILSNWVAVQYRQWLEEQQRANLLRAQATAEQPRREIRYDLSEGGDFSRYFLSIPDSQKEPLAILCGMSQMYAINNYKPGDQTISEWMDDQAAPKRGRVFGLAAPSLCNEEAMFLLLSTASHPKTTPKLFIYGLCFDKFRFLDLRPSYQLFLANHPEVQRLWEAVARNYASRYPLASAKMLQSLQDARASMIKVGDESLEGRLRGWISRYSPLVAERKELNTAVQMQLYEARNWLLHIKSTTKRPVIEGRYELNQQFLEMMMDVAEPRHIQLAMYIIPLNPQGENPYIPAQYEEFKAWADSICHQRGVPFANLENEVPADDWGTFLGGPDFKHFKAIGHRLTAQAVLERFGPLLFQGESPPAPAR